MKKEVRYVIMKNKKDDIKTLAVDFDGVIVEPNSGVPTLKCKILKDLATGESAKEVLNQFKKEGWTIIIHSCRDDVKGMKKFLDKNKVPWDYINENPLQKHTGYGTPMSSSKIYANIYLDDKAVTFKDWSMVYDSVIRHRLMLDKLRPEGRKVLE